MRKTGRWLLLLLTAAVAWGQADTNPNPTAPAAVEAPAISLRPDQLQKYYGQYVQVHGTTGNYIEDPSPTTKVIRFTDFYNHTVRLRMPADRALKPQVSTVIFGTVTTLADGQFEIIFNPDGGGDTPPPPPPPPPGPDRNEILLYAGIGLVVLAAIVLLVMWRQSVAARQRQEILAAEQAQQEAAQRQAELERRLAQAQAPPQASTVMAAGGGGRSSTVMTLGKLDAVAGPHAGQTFPLASTVSVIGRTEGDVQLTKDETASGRHGRIVFVGDGNVTYTDESRNGTRLNGKTVHQAQHELKNGDTLEIGLTTLKFTNFRTAGAAPGAAAVGGEQAQRRAETVMAPGNGGGGGAAAAVAAPAVKNSRAATAMYLGAELGIVRGPDEGRSFPLQKAVSSIGRMDDQDIQLSDATVSRRHATLRHENGQFVLTNLSERGTQVGGKPITEHVLQPDDEIELGGTVMKFRSLK